MEAGLVLKDVKLELERDLSIQDGSPKWQLIWARGSVFPLLLFEAKA